MGKTSSDAQKSIVSETLKSYQSGMRALYKNAYEYDGTPASLQKLAAQYQQLDALREAFDGVLKQNGVPRKEDRKRMLDEAGEKGAHQFCGNDNRLVAEERRTTAETNLGNALNPGRAVSDASGVRRPSQLLRN